MSNIKYSILSTKLLSPELVREAAEQGIAVTSQLFIDIQPSVTDEATDDCKNLLFHGGVMVFTSPNAVKALASEEGGLYEYLQDRSFGFHTAGPTPCHVYCLQGATLAAVEEHMPYLLVAATAANSAELAQKMLAHEVSVVTFFCGNIRRQELPDMLRANGVGVTEHVVYRTTETPATLEETFNGILFLSPSSVRSFFSANRLPGHTVCFAIGETTAEALREVTDNKVIVSPTPSMSALLETAIYYFNNINCYE
ncbi:uroporphyrinogen-III synthase [Chitinophaga lutea]|uniref:Uroporphyrinogen-III synthase n=1 Tax=Chitinophaga lutea TaxID=2488634 RepID=A0A3N4PL04_9BACT|nr:uroporphyrinogen-III synthase [Chitinophaga lutea]RPE09362.1 uroporphyrinogen-III synthase [Chitinophaga lutea]